MLLQVENLLTPARLMTHNVMYFPHTERPDLFAHSPWLTVGRKVRLHTPRRPHCAAVVAHFHNFVLEFEFSYCSSRLTAAHARPDWQPSARTMPIFAYVARVNDGMPLVCTCACPVSWVALLLTRVAFVVVVLAAGQVASVQHGDDHMSKYKQQVRWP